MAPVRALPTSCQTLPICSWSDGLQVRTRTLWRTALQLALGADDVLAEDVLAAEPLVASIQSTDW